MITSGYVEEKLPASRFSTQSNSEFCRFWSLLDLRINKLRFLIKPERPESFLRRASEVCVFALWFPDHVLCLCLDMNTIAVFFVSTGLQMQSSPNNLDKITSMRYFIFGTMCLWKTYFG